MQELDPYVSLLVSIRRDPEIILLIIPMLLYLWFAFLPFFSALYKDGPYRKGASLSVLMLVIPVIVLIALRSLRTGSRLNALLPLLGLLTAIILLVLVLRLVFASKGRIATLWNLSLIAGFAVAILPVINLDRTTMEIFGYPHGPQSLNQLPRLLVQSLLFLFLTLYLGILYEKWVEGKLTDAERVVGRAGFAAWLSPGRLVLCLLIAACAWYGYRYSFPIVFILAGLGLTAYPLNRAFATIEFAPELSPGATMPGAAVSAAERARILKLLEDGRINAQECHELLQALSESTPPPPPSTKAATLPQRLRWLGAGLILFGFFLPWFVVDIGREMQRAAERAGEMASRMAETPNPHPADFGIWNSPEFRQLTGRMGTVTIGAEDLKHGLGFWILLLGLGALVLPWAIPVYSPTTLNRIALLALAAGGILTLYLTLTHLRQLNAGPLVTLLGYALAIVAICRGSDFKLPASVAPRIAQAD